MVPNRIPTSLMLAACLSALLTPAAAAAAAAASTVYTTAPPAPTSTSYTSDSAFQADMLAAHNFYREEHNASALTWNDTSAKYAAAWSGNCNFKHSGGPTGENLAAGYPNASASVDAWGLERENYNWKKPGFSEGTGHFTQVVWRNTTSVGCGRKGCDGTNGTPGFYVVCEYYPAGNIVGDNNQYFIDNVKQQVKGHKTDTVESGVTGAGNVSVELRWIVGVLCSALVVGLNIIW